MDAQTIKIVYCRIASIGIGIILADVVRHYSPKPASIPAQICWIAGGSCLISYASKKLEPIIDEVFDDTMSDIDQVFGTNFSEK